uniref:Uncharacterized protein n=1 Tax=Aegilops tauschii subsp. strangulata TaxID=200361 RepID=A0A453GB71_AEGTS
GPVIKSGSGQPPYKIRRVRLLPAAHPGKTSAAIAGPSSFVPGDAAADQSYAARGAEEMSTPGGEEDKKPASAGGEGGGAHINLKVKGQVCSPVPSFSACVPCVLI